MNIKDQGLDDRLGKRPNYPWRGVLVGAIQAFVYFLAFFLTADTVHGVRGVVLGLVVMLGAMVILVVLSAVIRALLHRRRQRDHR